MVEVLYDELHHYNTNGEVRYAIGDILHRHGHDSKLGLDNFVRTSESPQQASMPPLRVVSAFGTCWPNWFGDPIYDVEVKSRPNHN